MDIRSDNSDANAVDDTPEYMIVFDTYAEAESIEKILLELLRKDKDEAHK